MGWFTIKDELAEQAAAAKAKRDKIRRIEIVTRKLSNQVFAGSYHSAFKGRGISFSEVREYQYGDDVRLIDQMLRLVEVVLLLKFLTKSGSLL